MSRHWIFAAWLPDDIDYGVWSKNCSLLNGADVFGARQPNGTVWRDFPVAKLAIKFDQPLPDCFNQEGYTFVSSDLRAAMALEEEAARFFDVDASASTRAAQEKGYKILNVATLENAIDAASSALTMGRLAPGSPELVLDHGPLSFAPGFVPRHEMFADKLVGGYQFCTDPLAARVLEANCTGVRFFDANRFGGFAKGPKNPFRTRIGIEQSDWDFVADKPTTILLERF